TDVGSQLPNRRNCLPRSPVPDRDALLHLFHDLEVHRPLVGLGNNEHLNMHSIYRVTFCQVFFWGSETPHQNSWGGAALLVLEHSARLDFGDSTSVHLLFDTSLFAPFDFEAAIQTKY